MTEDFEKNILPEDDDPGEKVLSLKELGLILGNAAVQDKRGSTPEYIGYVMAILTGGLVQREYMTQDNLEEKMKPFLDALRNGSGEKINVHLGDDLTDVLDKTPDAFDDGRRTKVISVSVGDGDMELSHVTGEEIKRVKAVNDLLRSVGKDDNPEEHRGSRA